MGVIRVHPDYLIAGRTPKAVLLHWKWRFPKPQEEGLDFQDLMDNKGKSQVMHT